MLSLVFVSSIILTGTSSGWSAQVVIPSVEQLCLYQSLVSSIILSRIEYLTCTSLAIKWWINCITMGLKLYLQLPLLWNLSENDRIVYKDFIDYANTGRKVSRFTGLPLKTLHSRQGVITSTTRRSFFESVLKLSKSYGFNFVGYTVDIEPHTLTDWDIRQERDQGRLINALINPSRS